MARHTRVNNGSGFHTASRPPAKSGRRGFLAALLGVAAAGTATYILGPSLLRAFNDPEKPSPDKIADYFIYVTLPESAVHEHKILYLPPDRLAALRDAIIRYEQIALTAEDVLATFYGPEPSGTEALELEWIRNHMSDSLKAGDEPYRAAIRALQALEKRKQESRHERNPSFLPGYVFEIPVRNRRFNEIYGMMTEGEAQEIAAIHPDASWQDIQKDKTIIDFYTHTQEASRRGLCSYWMARTLTIQAAADSLKNGTFNERVENGRGHMETTPPMRYRQMPPPQPTPQLK